MKERAATAPRERATPPPRWLGLAVAALALVHPEVALACPVCFSATSERVLHAYYLTAAVMTALPLVIVGTLGVWLYRNRAGRESGPARDG